MRPGRAVEVVLHLGPFVLGDLAAQLESVEVIRLDVVAAQDARHAGQLGRSAERRQGIFLRY